jgi:hypothetical protein
MPPDRPDTAVIRTRNKFHPDLFHHNRKGGCFRKLKNAKQKVN